jgi:pimeloyl-ACP methyl ester carboxylesterase
MKAFTFPAVFILVFGMLFPSVSAYEIGQVSTSYFDPVRSRDIGVSIYYPADTPGSSVPVAEGHFPVVVFGHGFLLGTNNYQFLSNDLVPQGYIVVLPTTESGFSPNHLTFGKDMAFLCDHFQFLNGEPDSLFFNHIAPGGAIMGHSMGGGSSFLAIEHSASVTAIANFAAAETSPSAIAAAETIDLPALMFAGTQDCVTPPENHQIPMYDALSSQCRTLISINGASHCQFAQNAFICTLGETGSGCDATITLNEQETITLQYLGLWLDSILKDESTAWTAFQDLLDTGAATGTITYLQDCETPEPTPSPTPTSAPTLTPTPDCINSGDANLDGVLTAADAQLIFYFALGSETPSPEQECPADCNGDGVITAGDAQKTFNAVLGSDECNDPILGRFLL